MQGYRIYSSSKKPQEHLPLVGKLIDKAHVEPLPLKNNAWGYFFQSIAEGGSGKIQTTNNMQNICRDTTGYLSWETGHCT